MDYQLSLTVLDCPEPARLAAFYHGLLGGEVAVEPDGGWAEVVPPLGGALAFQRVAHFVAPTWPEGPVPQQLHLDLLVDDLDAGEADVVARGAQRAAVQPGTTFRVFLDPAGHPFCLVARTGSGT